MAHCDSILPAQAKTRIEKLGSRKVLNCGGLVLSTIPAHFIGGSMGAGVRGASVGSGGMNGAASAWLITLCLGFATCARGGFGINHMDLAPQYAGILLASQCLSAYSLSTVCYRLFYFSLIVCCRSACACMVMVSCCLRPYLIAYECVVFMGEQWSTQRGQLLVSWAWPLQAQCWSHTSATAALVMRTATQVRRLQAGQPCSE